MNAEHDEDAVEITLRPAPEVAARLLLVASLCRRAFVEGSAGEAAGDEAAGERFDLGRWLADEGLLAQATPEERRLLDPATPVWSVAETTAASWQGEALLALGWALAMVGSMPAYDAPADLDDLLSQIPEPWTSTVAFRRNASLRPELVIARERERAELWHWRSETASLLRSAPRQARSEIETAIRDVAAEALDAGLIVDLVAADFAVHGQAYSALPPTEVDDLGALAFERLRALDWLCGLRPSWTADSDDD